MGTVGQPREELWALWGKEGNSCGHCGTGEGTADGTVGQGREQLWALWDKGENSCGHCETGEGIAVGTMGWSCGHCVSAGSRLGA